MYIVIVYNALFVYVIVQEIRAVNDSLKSRNQQLENDASKLKKQQQEKIEVPNLCTIICFYYACIIN